MTMFTNQTAEELEAMRCTSEGIFNAQNSVWMKINFGLVYLVALITFFLSVKAAKILKCHNVYSNGTQFLLMSTLFNANLNQAVYFEIRIRHLVHVLIHATDPCQIEFHTPDCTYDHSVFAFTSVLSTWLVCALTCDRLLALFLRNFYCNNSKGISLFLISLAVILSLVVHSITYFGVSRAGYIPACYYPPQLSLNTFQTMNDANFAFTMFNCVLTVFILLASLYKDRRIRQSVYETKLRYASFENLLTTKAICSITSTQFVFLSLSAAAVAIVRFCEAGLAEDVYHITVQYVTGILYSNLATPILIYTKTNKCIEQRRKSIGKMRQQTNHVDTHISSLRKMWE
ncbi:unnamed protein product [Caenorhabditis sp. 36 PRJEB53466]|nr:unnamed protein product [Caenorhabditis sp. 36 PRJEB53466]